MMNEERCATEVSVAVSGGVAREAVSLVRDSGRPKCQIAEKLVVSKESLRVWIRQDQLDGASATTA